MSVDRQAATEAAKEAAWRDGEYPGPDPQQYFDEGFDAGVRWLRDKSMREAINGHEDSEVVAGVRWAATRDEDTGLREVLEKIRQTATVDGRESLRACCEISDMARAALSVPAPEGKD